MGFILNVLWCVTFGFASALGWFFAGLIMAVSIIGIPWARAAFTMGLLVLWPFGRTVVSRDVLTRREDIGTGPLGFLGNVIWFLVAGWWLALSHFVLGMLLLVTIILIPFALQQFKFARLALAPIGMEVVDQQSLDTRYR